MSERVTVLGAAALADLQRIADSCEALLLMAQELQRQVAEIRVRVNVALSDHEAASS